MDSKKTETPQNVKVTPFGLVIKSEQPKIPEWPDKYKTIDKRKPTLKK